MSRLDSRPHTEPNERMIDIRRPVVLAALLALLPLAACGGEGGAGNEAGAEVAEEERYGGTLVVGLINDVPDISPLTSTDHNANQLQQFVLFMPLIEYNERFEPEPYLARSWEVNADTSLLTFHLRNDVYWHDGVKTTAYDVKFSYDRARDPNTGFPNSAFWTYYDEAEAVDSFTFRVRMRPHAEYMDPWRSFAPVPQHVLGDVPAAQLRTHPFATSRPLGNGPFRFVSRSPGQSWVFEANERFPAELGGRPYVDRIQLRAVPEATTLLTELLSGRLDYYIAPTPADAAAIQNSSTARLLSFDDRAFVILGWNERREPFDDVRVRRALTMAIDRNAIIEGIRFGFGKPANSTVPPIFWQYDQQAGGDLAYNPQAAKALLAEAGLTDRDGDGIVEDAQGRPFRFSIKTRQDSERVDIITKVQADLRAVGVAAEPQIVEWGTLLDQINDPVRRDFDAVVMGWVTEFRIDDSDLLACDKRDEPYQWVSYCNPQVDTLLKALPTIADREAARPLWSRYQRLVAHDQPYTFIYFAERLEGASNRMQGVDPDARGDWVNARRWWILPGQRGQGDS